MNGLRVFIRSILWVEIAAILGLLIMGAILTWAEGADRFGDTFFTYRIEHLDCLPAWLAGSLTLMAVNGFWLFRLASIEGRLRTPADGGWGEWGASLPVNPLRLFAINLIAIPGALALFLIIRANGW